MKYIFEDISYIPYDKKKEKKQLNQVHVYKSTD